jgi:hypothetical protein
LFGVISFLWGIWRFWRFHFRRLFSFWLLLYVHLISSSLNVQPFPILLVI